MLTPILSKSTCAACRVCCFFSPRAVWEMPLIDAENRKFVEEKIPGAEFVPDGDDWRFKVTPPAEGEYADCPARTPKGCALGEHEPFECRTWPFRVMRFNGRLVLALSPACEQVFARPLQELAAFAATIAPQVFAYAAAHPAVVKDFRPEYAVLAAED